MEPLVTIGERLMTEKNELEMMSVSIELNGEFLTTEVQINSTIEALVEGGHLRGISVNAIRVNGRPATNDTKLQDGDAVQAVPPGGKLA